MIVASRGILIPLFFCVAPAWTCAQPAPQQKEIRETIEQLVLIDGTEAPDPREITDKLGKGEITIEETLPPTNPNMIIPGDDSKPTPEEEAYKKRFNNCQKAFRKLATYRKAAFPILVEHFDDKRQSAAFENHIIDSSVGAACNYSIRLQLTDHPADYSFYGWSRKGRDGEAHPKPYYMGAPFDEAGGLVPWLKANDSLSYPEMQVKCLEWLLEKEKAIGVPDAEGYFESILPLEVQILRRRREAGQDVGKELDRLQAALKKKDLKVIPKGMLP